MATYYYAHVRRYQDESSTIDATYLVKNTQITLPVHKTNTKYYVYYLIDVYATTISNFNNWVITGSDGSYDGKRVSPNAGTNENNGLANGLTTSCTVNKNTTDTNVKVGDVVNDSSHYKVSFSRKGGTTNGQVVSTPSVELQWKSDASPNWTKIPANNIVWGTWPTSLDKAPSITWTTVVTAPVFPLVAIQAVIKELYGDTPQLQKNTVLAQNQIQILTNYTWDKCTNLWNFVVNYKTKQYGGKGYQAHWTCTKNGDQCRQASPEPSANDLSTKTKLAAWTKKYVTNPMIAAKSNAACGDNTSSGNGLKDITTVTPPKGDTRWNPPPHRDARGISHGERVNYGINDALNDVPAFSEKERGRIFQDINSAAVLNKNPDKLKELVSSKGATNQWGFRFMYNPTTFGYSSSSNNSVDWTLGASDPATLLTGNSSVSFEVYINRIPDLKYLRLKNPTLSEKQIYGRDLDEIEKQGILNRGTEYDIEFLYRVLNGDPLKESLLLSTKYKGATADFGYTTGVPCWLVLNENLRYYGSVASFQVNHAMFDLNMVPMLSTVSITFARYPALWNETAAFGTGASVASTKEYLASTPKG
jgi:hypothetical protein